MEEKNLQLQEKMRHNVHYIGRWYRFFAVVYIVMASLLVVAGVAMLLLGILAPDIMPDEQMGMPFPLWILGAIYIISGGLALPMIIYLFRAADAARTAVGLNSNEAAVRFMLNTKSYWKYCGILTIVMLGLSVLAVPASIILVAAMM